MAGSRTSARVSALRTVARAGGPAKDRLEDALARAVARRGEARTGSAPMALVVPSQRPGSLGDEAMVNSIVRRLKDQGATVGIAEYDDGSEWSTRIDLDYKISLARLFHVDRRFRADSYLDLIGFARAARGATHVFVIGADVIDGFYSASRSVKRLTLAGIGARCGADSRVINFSFNETPDPRAVTALERVPAEVSFFARDEDARQRIHRHVGRSATVHTDIAFNLEPLVTERVAAARDWAEAERAEGRIIVGVNVNPQTFPGDSTRGAIRVIDLYAESLATLLDARPEVSCLHIPHDWRPPVTEEETSERVIARLPEVARAHSHLVRGPYSAMEAKALAAECAAVLTGRMHLAIGALGAGVPPVCLPYQGKFEGLMKHFGTPELVLDLTARTEPVADQIVRVLDDLGPARAKIERALPEVLRGSRLPLDLGPAPLETYARSRAAGVEQNAADRTGSTT